MGDVVRWNGLTSLPINPDDILEAQKGKYDRVIVIGVDDDDKIAVSISDPSLVFNMFDLDRAKWILMRDVMSNE